MDTNPQAPFNLLGLSAELRVQIYQHAILSGLRCASTDGIVALSESCRLIHGELSGIMRKPRLKPFIQASRVNHRYYFLRMTAELTYGIFLAEESAACAKVTLQPYWSFNKQRPSYLAMNPLDMPQFEVTIHLAPSLQKILSLSWSTLTLQYLDKWETTLPTDYYRRIYRGLQSHLDSEALLQSTDRLVCHVGTREKPRFWPSDAMRAEQDMIADIRRAWNQMPRFPFGICWACCVWRSHSVSDWHFVYDSKEGFPEPDYATLLFVRTEIEAAYKAKRSLTLVDSSGHRNPPNSTSISIFLKDPSLTLDGQTRYLKRL